jgi:hypothetical protein
MVHMSHVQLDIVGRPKSAEEVQESHRIRTTGNSHEENVAPVEHSIVLDRPLDALQERIHT